MYEFLTSFGRKAWQFIERAVREDLSFEETFEALRTDYPEYEEKDAYVDFQRISQYADRWKELNTIPEDEAWGKDYYAPTEKPLSKRYLMTGKALIRNLDTGEEYYSKPITVGSDYIRTKGEFNDALMEKIEENKEKYEEEDYEIVDIDWVRGIRWG